MFIKRQRQHLTNIYHEYPRSFWTLVAVTFIDQLGGALLFPFFALYITSRFQVGMTEVGVPFALFSASSFVGSVLGSTLSVLAAAAFLQLGHRVRTAPAAANHSSR